MECRGPKRIVASFPRRRPVTHGEAHAAIAITVLRNLAPVAARERDSIAVVDRATGDRVRDCEQPWVVFVATLSIRLQRESTGPRSRVCIDYLDIKRFQQQAGAESGNHVGEGPCADPKRFGRILRWRNFPAERK